MPVAVTEIRPVGPEDRQLWDAFVLEHQGTMYHLWDWGEAIAATTGDRWYRLVATEGEAWVGMACCLERARYGQRWGLTPLLTPYTGMVLRTTERPKFQAQRHEARRRRFALLEEMQRHFQLMHLQTIGWDMRDYMDRGFAVAPRYTYCVDLDPWERVWVEMEGSTRRQVNKARKNEEIVLDEHATADEVERLTSGVFEKHDEESPITRPLLDMLLGDGPLTEHRMVLAARAAANGELLGVVVSMWDARRQHAHYVHAATHPEHLHTGVSSYLVWETLKRHSMAGMKVFDFCGANMPGIARFKEGFMPRLVTYYDVQWSRPAWVAPLRWWWMNRRRELPKL